MLTQTFLGQVAHILTIEQNGAFIHIIEAENQL